MKLDAGILQRAPAFAALPPEAFAALALCFRGRQYAPGEVVFREAEPGHSLFFVADGELVVTTRAGGAPRAVGRIGPGQLVGEGALIDPAPRSATVSAVRASMVYELGEDSLEVLRRASPTAARALLGAAISGVVRRLHRLERRIEQELDDAGAFA
jgi:CRP/FNR family transcriptional regulator, cyclic AMP receptor protein